MNDLIKAMASDMRITSYIGEQSDSYIYRVIYSALGRWCLEAARAKDGISKHGQTILLNNLLEKYTFLFPETAEMLIQTDQTPISVFIRRIYEETGYLITNQTNRNSLSTYQRGLLIDSKNLIYGLSEKTSIEGLGVFSDSAARYVDTWKEVILRDSLSCEEYVSSAFDVALFSARDIDSSNLQYFNPLTNIAPSSSWSNVMNTEKTIAHNLTNGMYYRVICYSNEMLYYDDASNTGTDRLTDFEYRRLYYALKKHYGFPLKAHVQSLDEHYSKVTLDGHLPNREYYLLLLYSWPYRGYWNRREFIMENNYIRFTREILENIGIEIKGD